MLFEQTHYFPLGSNSDPDWGAIILTTLVVGGILYVGYKLAEPKFIPSLIKKPENEKL